MALPLAQQEMPGVASATSVSVARGVSPTALAMLAADRAWVPDALIRLGIRRFLKQRLDEERIKKLNGAAQRFLDDLSSAPLAIHTEAANVQHYEVPATFYAQALGPRRKYSCCLYSSTDMPLAQAEEAMLALTVERAEIEDAMHVLDLGCGWGSLSLYLAERFPNARITGVSNSRSQRDYILAEARERGFNNVRIITADVNSFVAPSLYDRVVSIEMFEHLRNHGRMLQRIADWLRPGGKLFVHHFCHADYCYPYEASSPSDWMAEHFFTGGMMPSFDLLAHYSRDMRIEASWKVNGTHYQRTCEDWLRQLDGNRDEALKALYAAHGEQAPLWLQRWRLFFMACAELFGYHAGDEWFVGHYRLVRA